MASKNEVAARIMEHLVEHDGNYGHGYTQGANRWGNGTTEYINVDGETYAFAGGDRDCSSGVISAYEAAGVDCGSATYTGNMSARMCGTGNFERVPMSYIAQRGDIYLHDRDHTAMCKTAIPDVMIQFSINEYGQIVGGQEGDQNGRESNTVPYSDYPWNCILRYVGEGAGSGGGYVPPALPESGIPDIRYCVYTQNSGWLDEMVNHWCSAGSGDSYAGDGSPITYLAIDMPGWYQVCTQASGWLPPVRGYNSNDRENGCAGDGSPITGVKCYYETQHPDSTGWLGIEFAVANVGCDFFANMIDMRDTGGSGDDYAGNGGAISAFRARLVRV